MKEIVVEQSKKINLYCDLDTVLLKKMKNKYRTIQDNMLEVAIMATQLNNQSEEQFSLFAKNELNMSKGTVSKFLTAGRVVNCAESMSISLPSSYTAVYELNQISNDLQGFSEFYEKTENEKLQFASVRKIKKNVEQYKKSKVVINEQIEENTEHNETNTESPLISYTDDTSCNYDNLYNMIISDLETLKILVENNIAASECVQDLSQSIKLLVDTCRKEV